jgi:hypothetical protein
VGTYLARRGAAACMLQRECAIGRSLTAVVTAAPPYTPPSAPRSTRHCMAALLAGLPVHQRAPVRHLVPPRYRP